MRKLLLALLPTMFLPCQAGKLTAIMTDNPDDYPVFYSIADNKSKGKFGPAIQLRQKQNKFSGDGITIPVQLSSGDFGIRVWVCNKKKIQTCKQDYTKAINWVTIRNMGWDKSEKFNSIVFERSSEEVYNIPLSGAEGHYRDAQDHLRPSQLRVPMGDITNKNKSVRYPVKVWLEILELGKSRQIIIHAKQEGGEDFD